MKKTIKACGYIRVSSPAQAEEDKTSPEQQRESIKGYVENKGWEFLRFYEDLGISGGKMVGRIEMQRLLDDALTGEFQKVVADKLDRFGRNTEDLTRTKRELEEADIDLLFVSETFEDTHDGDLQFDIKAGISAWEKRRIKERFLKGRVKRLEDGGASVGQLPYARYYEKVLIKGKMKRDYVADMKLDEEKANMIRDAAKQYLAGGSLRKIAAKIPSNSTKGNGFLCRRTLTVILRDCCGDKWTITYRAQKKIKKLREPVSVTLPMPRILDDLMIKKVRDRLKYNTKYERQKHLTNYPLSGFLKCPVCERAYSGQTQHKIYRYYKHAAENTDCKVDYVKAELIEDAVFKIIFEQTYDEQGFMEAIKDSLPDPAFVNSLKEKIAKGEKAQQEKTEQYKHLVRQVTKGVLMDDSLVRAMQTELTEELKKIQQDLEEATTKLSSLPSLEQSEKDAYEIRLGLLDYYGSEDRLKKMSYDEKRTLLYNLFHGHDAEVGKDFGIYLTKKGKTVEIELLADIFWGSKVVKDHILDSSKGKKCRQAIH